MGDELRVSDGGDDGSRLGWLSRLSVDYLSSLLVVVVVVVVGV
jgi:hypothetical protein